jgi:hypothetical protein
MAAAVAARTAPEVFESFMSFSPWKVSTPRRLAARWRHLLLKVALSNGPSRNNDVR